MPRKKVDFAEKNISILIDKKIVDSYSILSIKLNTPRKLLIEETLKDCLNKINDKDINSIIK